MKRNSYGEIIQESFHTPETQFDRDLMSEARCLVALAVKRKKIDWAYDTISFDRKGRADGSALHHEIYDISEDGRHVLLCVRETEGSKYGVRTTSKRYFILSAHGARGVRVIEASKAKAAKAAKQAGDDVYGFAIACCLNKAKLKAALTQTRICYKIVGLRNGFPVSVYDGSAWDLGKTRRERSSMNHESGFYVFPTRESAMDAWVNRLAFRDEWMTEAEYAMLECECAGRSYTFDGNKMCISAVTPIREIEKLEVAS